MNRAEKRAVIKALGICFVGTGWVGSAFLGGSQTKISLFRRAGPFMSKQDDPLLFWGVIALAFVIGVVILVYGLVKLRKSLRPN